MQVCQLRTYTSNSLYSLAVLLVVTSAGNNGLETLSGSIVMEHCQPEKSLSSIYLQQKKVKTP